MATTKERLYRLIDELPESEMHAVVRFVEFVRERGDPFLHAVRKAPLDDEPLHDDDRKALAEARRELKRGEGIPDEELQL